jgi:hypothetical protein
MAARNLGFSAKTATGTVLPQPSAKRKAKIPPALESADGIDDCPIA